jgi:hypothetical protein
MCFGLYDSLAQWLMMAFTIIAAGLLFGTLLQANKTNIGVLEANAIMRLEQRPWLTLDILDGSELDFKGQGAVCRIPFQISNKGKTPAFYTWFSAGIHAVEGHRDIADIVDGLGAATPGKDSTGAYQVIFPGEKFEVPLPEKSVKMIQGNAGNRLSMVTVIIYRTAPKLSADFGIDVRAYNFFQTDEQKASGNQFEFKEMIEYRITR